MNAQNNDAQGDSEQIERARINAETAQIPWQELQRFFAQGIAVAVDPALDLVDVAVQMSRDNKSVVKGWMDEGLVAPVADEQAAAWLAADMTVWSVVVRPWILVQENKVRENKVQPNKAQPNRG